MTLGGWMTFLISVLSVTSFFVWCVSKVLRAKRVDKIHDVHFEDPFDD